PANYILQQEESADSTLHYRFAPSNSPSPPQPALEIPLEPGDSARVKLTVQAPWRLVGRPYKHTVTVKAIQEDEDRPIVRYGDFVQRPLPLRWLLLLLLLLGLGWGALRFLEANRPTVVRFWIDPTPPVAGTPARLIWQIINGPTVQIKLGNTLLPLPTTVP